MLQHLDLKGALDDANLKYTLNIERGETKEVPYINGNCNFLKE